MDDFSLPLKPRPLADMPPEEVWKLMRSAADALRTAARELNIAIGMDAADVGRMAELLAKTGDPERDAALDRALFEHALREREAGVAAFYAWIYCERAPDKDEKFRRKRATTVIRMRLYAATPETIQAVIAGHGDTEDDNNDDEPPFRFWGDLD
jgi:hypothetical protein